MSATIAKHEGSALAIHDDQDFFNQTQLAALRQMGVDRASEGDLRVFFHQSQRTGLDPFARQIYMIERQGKQTIQTGIDGFRLVARRATDRSGGTFGYEDTQWCGEDGKWRDVWLSKEPPAAARVTVIRNGDRFPAIALFSEYAGTKRDGSLTQMWSTKGALMLAKCAEALALRRAFPQDLSGLYTGDEMQQAGNPAPAQASRQGVPTSGLAAAREAIAQQAPASPATPTPPTMSEVDDCDDLDTLRAMWRHSTGDVRALIEAKVEDLKNVNQTTGEVVEAEVVEDGDES